MKTLYLWEKIVIGIIAFLTFIAVLQQAEFQIIGLFGAVMGSAINVLILWALFKLGNRIFKSKKTIAQAVDIKN